MYFWKIADGRIWSATEAAFVAEAPAGEAVTPLARLGVPADIDYLRETIAFYGFDLGELAGKIERIARAQERYSSELKALNEAYLSAQMDGDEEAMAEIAGEKRELRAAMAAEIQAIEQEGK